MARRWHAPVLSRNSALATAEPVTASRGQSTVGRSWCRACLRRALRARLFLEHDAHGTKLDEVGSVTNSIPSCVCAPAGTAWSATIRRARECAGVCGAKLCARIRPSPSRLQRKARALLFYSRFVRFRRLACCGTFFMGYRNPTCPSLIEACSPITTRNGTASLHGERVPQPMEEFGTCANTSLRFCCWPFSPPASL